MAISKDQALNNLARAYFAEKVEWQCWIESRIDMDQRVKYQRAMEHYDTMRQAYFDCDVITWEDYENAWFYNMELKRPIS